MMIEILNTNSFRMKKSVFVVIFFFGFFFITCKTETHTNFILIYLDDVGYGDVSLTGAVGYITPNIDKMAAQGMFFSH